MKNRDIASSSLVLRILTLLTSAASIGVLVGDKKTLVGDRLTFKDVQAYIYVVSVASIGAAYSLLQLPSAIYHARKGKRLNQYSRHLDFYGDKIVSLLLATAVGAGFAVSVEIKRGEIDFLEHFLNVAMIATGLLLVAAVCMAIVSVLSSINWPGREGVFGN